MVLGVEPEVLRGRTKREGYSGNADANAKKRGVPRLHGNMLPGNSFPQICVVSGAIIWESSNGHKST
jgi:hypothetical protein